MKTLTNTQIIKQNGVPVFAVIDWDKYQDLLRRAGDIVSDAALNDDANYTPHQVIELIFNKNYATIQAWRIYLGFTQQQIADKLGLSQVEVAKLEQIAHTQSNDTIHKLAKILAIHPQQLLD